MRTLPLRGFKRLSREMIDKFDASTIPDDNHLGYIVEVTLEFPEEIHNKLKDFPPLASKAQIAPCQWSPYMHSIWSQSCLPPKQSTEKLVQILGDHNFYVLHYVHLKLCLQLGLKLKKVHRGIEFVQSAWMKGFIEKNCALRRNAKSKFEKNYYKIFNCSVFGKCIENVTKRTNVRLITNDEQYYRLSRQNNFGDIHIYDRNFAGVVMQPRVVLLNKPIIVGFSVLELAKEHLFRFYHVLLRPRFGDNIKLAYSDTDSLIFSIEDSRDFDEFILDHRKHFDTSNYPINHPCRSLKNEAVPGKWKNECPNRRIASFVGLKSKVYCIRFVDDEHESEKRMKGIPRTVVKKTVSDQFLVALTRPNEIFQPLCQYDCIRTRKHEIYTICEKKKLPLSAFDDKRYICEDGVHTLPYFHKDIHVT